MNCCTSLAIDKQFDERTARKDANRYMRKGLEKPARRLFDAILARGVEGASVLEVGAGVGGLHLELLMRGAARALDVDLSAAYIDAAFGLAKRAGQEGKVEYRQADFASEASTIAPADIVILHRVVCCYPNMPGLLRPAADRARRLLALSYPRDNMLMRVGMGLANAWLSVTGSAFRAFVHPQARINAVIHESGLRLLDVTHAGVWRIAVYERPN